jgi:hypothetical protein
MPTAVPPVPAVSVVELMVKPPMVPLVALSAPACVTLNGASPIAVAPAQNPAPGFIWTRVTPVPAYRPSVTLIVKPPTAPPPMVRFPLESSSVFAAFHVSFVPSKLRKAFAPSPM